MGSACCCCGKSETIPLSSEKRPSRSVTGRIQREYSAKLSFTNISVSGKDPLELINGYLDEPLLPLEEALKPFDGKIYQLSYYIKEAKTRCHYPSEHHLTRDESAAIYIYTMKWGDGCLYDHLQDAWKSEDPSKLKPWFKYLKLFKTAFDKLPNATTEIWQGTSSNEKLKQLLTSSSPILYSSMGSASPSEQEVKAYLEKHSGSKMILIGFKSINGKLATGYTAGNTKGYMVWPGAKLGVAKYVVPNPDGSVVIFHLTGNASE